MNVGTAVMVAKTHRGISVPLGSLACVVLLLPFAFSTFSRRRNSQPVNLQFHIYK